MPSTTAPTPLLRAARPFLKWAGGKTQLFEQLQPFVPEKFRTYHEPFLGGGAVFFALRPPRAQLSDVNDELVTCYQAVRDRVDELVTALQAHTYERDHFYKVRSLDPETLPVAERAARTIFLNKTGFNGLYRVNSSGGFNVPFGRFRNPTICNEENLRACSDSLQNVVIETRDFTCILEAAQEGDFAYLDPPYVPLSETAHFTSYIRGGFGWPEQERLAGVVKELTKRRVKVMLSNSDVPTLRELYADYRIETVAATRRINSRVDSRGAVPEIVVLNY